MLSFRRPSKTIEARESMRIYKDRARSLVHSPDSMLLTTWPASNYLQCSLRLGSTLCHIVQVRGSYSSTKNIRVR